MVICVGELTQAGGNIWHSFIHKLINCIWKRKNCESRGKNLLLRLFIQMVIKLTVVIV